MCTMDARRRLVQTQLVADCIDRNEAAGFSPLRLYHLLIHFSKEHYLVAFDLKDPKLAADGAYHSVVVY